MNNKLSISGYLQEQKRYGVCGIGIVLFTKQHATFICIFI